MSDKPKDIRTADGRFGAGNKASPGRPKLPEWFRDAGPGLIQSMLGIANDVDHDRRFDATKWCLERIYGKPIAEVEVSGDEAINELIAKLAKSEEPTPPK